MPRQSDDALSEVIGFILIIALITIFLSLWMTYVIPAEGRQQEIEHMNYVRDWFTQYKITADSLWINHDPDSKDLTSVTISNSLVLGSQGGATQAGGLFIPVMSPTGSTGSISVKNVSAEGGGVERIVFNVATPFEIPMWRLEFATNNNYWVPQTYYYQMGGVFLRQQTGTVARVMPLIFFPSENDAEIIIIRLDGGGESGLSGKGAVRIDTKLNSAQSEPGFLGGGNIKFILSDENAARGWENMLKEQGYPLPYRVNNEVRVTLSGNIQCQFANYTVSVQSIASLVD
ncbi:MAG: hypothetical protein Q7J09_08380 [Methanocalculus sp.]|uniref:hypothetical protein n=1 Tax=Methanocalculus sp. TaxID=2004547 RepID=UPI0027173B29|nr:hypothetical protein [Methanocalculus sp.]MDO9540002.1 hypothetical protein [Methanocalculus sp.]